MTNESALGPPPETWANIPPPSIDAIDVLPAAADQRFVILRFRETRTYPPRVMCVTVTADGGTIKHVIIAGELVGPLPVPVNIIPGLLIDVIRTAVLEASETLLGLDEVIQLANFMN